MQSTFSVPNGSVSGFIPAQQLQPVMQPMSRIHASQIQSTGQPNQTQVVFVHPSNQVQHQLHMNQFGWIDPRLNTNRMNIACQSDNQVQNGGYQCHWQQEKAILQQRYQLLNAEHQTALANIQTLSLQNNELDKKLKINQYKYQELNNTYVITMQREHNKHDALKNMNNETCIQLRNEKRKCDALTIELEESTKNLRNEWQKYKDLDRMHVETKKILHSERQKRNEAVEFIESKNKSKDEKVPCETMGLNSSSGSPVKSSLKEPYMEHVPVRGDLSKSSTYDPMKAVGVDADCEISKHVAVPPGFERSTRVSGQGVSKVE